MADRPKFFDDLAGVAGGAMSALAGVRDEAEALMRARIDEAIRHFDLAKREDVDAAMDLAAAARAGQEAAEAKAADAEAKLAGAVDRLAALEARVAALEMKSQPLGGGGPGMIA